ncbi:MAG: hypothetical protein NVSMB33_04010 [Ktedonobacteraceae bacterium]
MADKKKNANQSVTRNRNQSQMVAPPARSQSQIAVPPHSDGEEQSKVIKTVAREREERKVQESKSVRRDNKSQSKSPTNWQIRLRNNRYIRFIFDAYYELRHKVTWPSFHEARTMTIVVILLSIAVGLVLWIADLGLQSLFFLLTSLGGK